MEEASDPDPKMLLAMAIIFLVLSVGAVVGLAFDHRHGSDAWFWPFPILWLVSSVVNFRRARRARARRAKERALFEERQRRFPVGPQWPRIQPTRSPT